MVFNMAKQWSAHKSINRTLLGWSLPGVAWIPSAGTFSRASTRVSMKAEYSELQFDEWGQITVRPSTTVVLNSSPRDPLLCTFCMSSLINALDSDHQLAEREIHELNWVCQIQKYTKYAEQWVPRTGVENYCSTTQSRTEATFSSLFKP